MQACKFARELKEYREGGKPGKIKEPAKIKIPTQVEKPKTMEPKESKAEEPTSVC